MLARKIFKGGAAQRKAIFTREILVMNSNEKFQMVCENCGSLAIKIENPLIAPPKAVVYCGDCGNSRGTMGALRELAVLSNVEVPFMARSSAREKSGSELVSQHRELQGLRRKVQIAEANARAAR
jgi:hypothetical protein